jgi:hypothetical protein
MTGEKKIINLQGLERVLRGRDLYFDFGGRNPLTRTGEGKPSIQIYTLGKLAYAQTLITMGDWTMELFPLASLHLRKRDDGLIGKAEVPNRDELSSEVFYKLESGNVVKVLNQYDKLIERLGKIGFEVQKKNKGEYGLQIVYQRDLVPRV